MGTANARITPPLDLLPPLICCRPHLLCHPSSAPPPPILTPLAHSPHSPQHKRCVALLAPRGGLGQPRASYRVAGSHACRPLHKYTKRVPTTRQAVTASAMAPVPSPFMPLPPPAAPNGRHPQLLKRQDVAMRTHPPSHAPRHCCPCASEGGRQERAAVRAGWARCASSWRAAPWRRARRRRRLAQPSAARRRQARMSRRWASA